MQFEQELQHQVWAEKKIITLTRTVSDFNWSKDIPILEKSLKELYVHKLEIMWFWFSLCKKKSLKTLGEPPNFQSMDKEGLLSTLLKSFNEMINFTLKTDEKLILDLNWVKKPYEVTTHEIIYSILNHHTYHRGEIAIILKHLGIDVPETNYNAYMFEINELYE